MPITEIAANLEMIIGGFFLTSGGGNSRSGDWGGI
jgi:hypothetical protein